MQGRACVSCGAFFAGAESACRFCGVAAPVTQGAAFDAAVQAAVRQDLNRNGIPDILEPPPPTPEELAARESARKTRSQIELAFGLFIGVLVLPVVVMAVWMAVRTPAHSSKRAPATTQPR